MQIIIKNSLKILMLIGVISTFGIYAQGHGGPGGGHGDPGFGHDSTSHDSSGYWGGGHGGPGGPGFGHDSTSHDSSGHWGGGHGGPGGGHGGPGSGHGGRLGHGDSTSLDSIAISGMVSIVMDTIVFHQMERIHTAYLLDVDFDDTLDYKLVHLRVLAHHDSTFILPVDGTIIEISGLVVPVEDDLDRIIVLALSVADDDETIGTVLGVDQMIDLSSHELRGTNYPNPFNPSTTIEFRLLEAGLTTLKIYDIRGVEIDSPLKAHLEAGLHQIQFNPGNLSGGTYLYAIEANGLREVHKMVYLK